jgi:2-aminobenzoylacetyl-CoA thioesterase
MIIENPGSVTDRIFMLGRRESCVYLLDGNGEYALLGGGMAYIIPEVISQLDEMGIEEEKIRRIVILHSHFDHCAIVPFLKKRWPQATVTASARARELLVTPKVIDGIRFLNDAVSARYERQGRLAELGVDFQGIEVESVAAEGDRYSCGDLSLEILEVPGHSSCSIAVYVEELKAMFTSDSGGIPFGDKVFTAANSNFDKYMQSLEKITGYDVNVVLAEHYGARTRGDARNFLKKAEESAVETRKFLETSYARTGDVGKSTEEVTEMLMSQAPAGFMPKEVVAIVTGQMLKQIARKQG